MHCSCRHDRNFYETDKDKFFACVRYHHLMNQKLARTFCAYCSLFIEVHKENSKVFMTRGGLGCDGLN